MNTFSWKYKHPEAYIVIIIISSCLILMLQQQAAQARSLSNSAPDAPNLHDQNQKQPIGINPSYQFDMQVNPHMQMHKLSPTSNNITCNDGSPVGYYMRLNKHSKSWIIYLQGGGFCGNEESCQQRWQRSPHLMSSNYWPKTKTVEGILSTEPKENPYLWNANHIYVPYCSSDSWTGLAQADVNNGSSFTFMGSKIIERVLDSLYDDLPPDSSLHEAKFILLAGDSAGATGVILNLDKVNEIVQRRASSIRTQCMQNNCDDRKQSPVLRGLADSGWFLDNEPYDYGRGDAYANEQDTDSGNQGDDCNRQRCSPSQSIKHAKIFWNGQVPLACSNQYPLEPWRCYFGYRTYQTLQTPLFVVQWLYDEAQLMVDNIARPDTNGQWNYVNKVVNEMRTSLENVTALFAPSCFAHSLIIRRIWNQININGFKLPHVLNSWEEQSLLATTTAITEPGKQTKLDDTSNAHDTSSKAYNTMSTEYSSSISVAQQSTSGLPARNNSSLPSIVNQPTFETVLVDQQESQSNPAPLGLIGQKDIQRAVSTHSISQSISNRNNPPTSVSANSNRSRLRKRKRNNQHQRTKQVRQKPIESVSITPTTELSPSYLSTTKESNDLVSLANPLQDLLPLIDRSLASADLLYGRLNRDTSGLSQFNNGRLGRSTIVDDATLMQSNNVPDDSSSTNINIHLPEQRVNSKWPLLGNGFISPYKQPHHLKTDRFRLIDSCGWPQCNRDCPVLDSELNLGGLIQF